MKLLALAILGLSGAALAAGESTLTAKRLGERLFELELVTDQTADVAVAQRALVPAARQLCGSGTARFGHYEFESAEPMPGQPPAPARITLRQQIHCDPDSSPAPAAPSARLAPHDDRAIEELTHRYLAARDSGSYAEAYALFAPSMKAATALESWSASTRNFNARAGTVKSRRIKKITWYDNPPSAPALGTYAAADYESESENARVYCGYVAWHGTAEGSFRIVREELNFIDRDSAAQMAPEQLKAFAERFGCELR